MRKTRRQSFISSGKGSDSSFTKEMSESYSSRERERENTPWADKKKKKTGGLVRKWERAQFRKFIALGGGWCCSRKAAHIHTL